MDMMDNASALARYPKRQQQKQPAGFTIGLKASTRLHDEGFFPRTLTVWSCRSPFLNLSLTITRVVSGTIAATGEDYDLVVVGGGISGLAAAHLYRARRPGARILILDNHDDVGGHAKRNEFALAGRLALMNGGTYSIDSPRPYSAIADGLVRTLGVDPVALTKKCADESFYAAHGLARGVFFDRETFGADKLVVARKGAAWRDILAGAPLPEKARGDIVRIEEGTTDYFPGLSSAEKKARLARMSYRDFLRDVVKADPAAIAVYQARSHGEWGVGADAVSALDVWAFDFPGFQGLKLEPGSAPHMGYTAAGYADGGSYTFHFPDGNASLARLLVRDLIPESLPGTSAEDVVTARLDYTLLDRPQASNSGSAPPPCVSAISAIPLRQTTWRLFTRGVERFHQCAHERACSPATT